MHDFLVLESDDDEESHNDGPRGGKDKNGRDEK